MEEETHAPTKRYLMIELSCDEMACSPCTYPNCQRYARLQVKNKKLADSVKPMELRLDRLITEVQDIDHRISSYLRGNNKKVSREPDVHINYLKSSQLTRKNLEKAILLLQNQIDQTEAFMHDIESYLHRHSFVHSGVATSVLFDQITYLLSNIDVRLLDMTRSMEDMFSESVGTIFHYQVGESFKEPQKEEVEDLINEIEKRAIVREYKK